MMTDKIIAMPTDDEMFAAFQHALEVGVPAEKKNIVSMFEKFLGKAKEHLKKIVSLTDTGLALNLTMQTGDELMDGFVDAQGFLLKLPLKAVLSTFGAGSFTEFVNSTKSGKNNKETTVNGIANITAACFEKLAEKYAVVDTNETIKTKVAALFNDAPAA